MGIVALLTATALPQALATMDHSRATAAARYIAARMARARVQAVARAATVAVRFEEDGTGVRLATFLDGNRNGVGAAEILRGVDTPLDAPVHLGDLFSGVVVGSSPTGSPLRPGATTLMSFTPVGTSSSNTIYILGRDNTRLAVRVLGVTARTRVLRYDAGAGDWVALF